MTMSSDIADGQWAKPWHLPVVVRRTDGLWGAHCDACSRVAGDYVYPCRVDTTRPEDWPPPRLAELAEDWTGSPERDPDAC